MKIYLSRSNEADPEVFSLVRDELRRLGATVLENIGGAYDPKSILKADYLLIVPPAKVVSRPGASGVSGYYEQDNTAESYSLGKGQVSQIMEFATDKGECEEEGSSIDCDSIFVLTRIVKDENKVTLGAYTINGFSEPERKNVTNSWMDCDLCNEYEDIKDAIDFPTPEGKGVVIGSGDSNTPMLACWDLLK